MVSSRVTRSSYPIIDVLCDHVMEVRICHLIELRDYSILSTDEIASHDHQGLRSPLVNLICLK
jgi:hypothetical protein